MMAKNVTIFDRALGAISPELAYRRERAKMKLDFARRARAEFDGATTGRRADGWKRRNTDANGELTGRTRQLLAATSRDLVRNNPHAANGVGKWADHLVGAGILFTVLRNGKFDAQLNEVARMHLDSTACDAEGQLNIYGLQHLAARTIVESGAVLVRRRWRRVTDRLPLPFQLQLLEPDYLDSSKDMQTTGGNLVGGIEFDMLGRRKGYWLYSGHPGSRRTHALGSKRVDEADIAHCYRKDRPEQAHGATWFAPILLKLNDYADLEDATLMRHKVASAFTAFISGDPDGAAAGSGSSNVDGDNKLEALEPGIVEYMAEGEKIEFSDPPAVEGHKDFAKLSLHAISAGIELPYEIMTGDLSEVTFISGRLGRLSFKRTLEQRQWAIFVGQFGEKVGRWLLQALQLAGYDITGVTIAWTPPPLEMAAPEIELPAYRDAIRAGQVNLSDFLREKGIDPDTHFAQRAADNAAIDAAGLILDSDPRRVTAVGNAVSVNIDPSK